MLGQLPCIKNPHGILCFAYSPQSQVELSLHPVLQSLLSCIHTTSNAIIFSLLYFLISQRSSILQEFHILHVNKPVLHSGTLSITCIQQSSKLATMTQQSNQRFAILILGALFFVFGFITWANNTLITYLKIACQLTDTQSFFVASAFFSAYFFMAIPSSMILRKTGFKVGMSIGLFTMSIGALLFIPAAYSRTFSLFLIGLFIIGTGLALLQTASNPYVTILGPIESAAKRISIMGICNKVAGIAAIFILGSIALKDVDGVKARLLTLDPIAKAAELDLLSQRVVLPYIIIAICLALLGSIIYFIHLPEISEEASSTEDAVQPTSQTSVFQFPNLIFGVVAIFLYVGVEVISYDTFTAFGEHLGFPLEVARTFATYTGYALLIGYVIGIVAIPKYLNQSTALRLSCILSILFVSVACFTTGNMAVACFALLGLSNALIWPAVWPLAINGLGKFTKIGSALLIMGIVGGAILPPLYGKFGELLQDKQMAYLLMIPCYLFILWYGWKAKGMLKQA
jgi:glucose/galactose transporter